MMKKEFEELTGKKVCNETYNMWERMYMASELTKQEFCKIVKKAVVADAYKDSCEEEMRELKAARDKMLANSAAGTYNEDDSDDFYLRLHNIEFNAYADERRYNYYKENGAKYDTFTYERKEDVSYEEYKYDHTKVDPCIWVGHHGNWSLMNLYRDAKGVWRYEMDNSKYNAI